MGNNKKKYTIGIDIGGTKILACLLNQKYEILSEIKSKTKPDKGQRVFLKTLVENIHFLLRDANVSHKEVIGIGIGCPGFINAAKGVIIGSPNIPFLKNFPLGPTLTRAFKVPVTLGNDVQTGLYGEHQLGAAKGKMNVVGIFMGTGIGGALILNGHPYRGTSGSAGEVGHVQMDPDGPLCGCGQHGCMEAFAGRLAISSEAAILAARQSAPYLAHKVGTDLRNIKSGVLAKAIRSGDKAVENLIRTKARFVGTLMADLVNILNPEMIVLGGGVVEAMPSLIAREAEKTMRQIALPSSAKHVTVAVAKLGDHSIVMGAAKRAEDMFTERRKEERRRG